MGDLNVIDRFMAAFIRYIDSGFGLLGPDIGFLTTVLIGIDITLAGLFWAMGGEDDVIAKLIRKILYVGVFALILGSFSTLADIIFKSFAGLGLVAGGGGMTADDLLKPGRLAATGFEAGWPLLDQATELVGPVAFFTNFVTIMVLIIAWIIVIVAFFVLAVQMFITIIEFKLTSLAGFVLVPFALWNRTAFLAERVLGNVVSSGIKVMVLAVIVGIGANFFSEMTNALQGEEPDLAQAMTLALASLSLLGLGIFGPSIASGLVAGAPQLGAGAAIGATAAAAGTLIVGGGAGLAAARAGGGAAMGALRAGTSMGSAASTAYKLGQETSGSASVGAGLSGMASAAGGAVRGRLASAGSSLGLGAAAERGQSAAFDAMVTRKSPSPAGTGGSAEGGSAAMPDWAQKMQGQNTARHHRHIAMQAIRDGDRGGASATPDIKEKED